MGTTRRRQPRRPPARVASQQTYREVVAGGSSLFRRVGSNRWHGRRDGRSANERQYPSGTSTRAEVLFSRWQLLVFRPEAICHIAASLAKLRREAPWGGLPLVGAGACAVDHPADLPYSKGLSLVGTPGDPVLAADPRRVRSHRLSDHNGGSAGKNRHRRHRVDGGPRRSRNVRKYCSVPGGGTVRYAGTSLRIIGDNEKPWWMPLCGGIPFAGGVPRIVTNEQYLKIHGHRANVLDRGDLIATSTWTMAD